MDPVRDNRHLSHPFFCRCDLGQCRWSIRDNAEQRVQHTKVRVLAFCINVCVDRAGDKRLADVDITRTILGRLKVVLVVSCLQIYRVPFTLMVFRLVETDDAISQFWWDEVIAPVVDHGPVNGEVTVEGVVLNEVL
jgi:hypothetical protein